MGRKGIGKLSALSVSENVNVMTIANGEKFGFVLSRIIESDGKLQPILDDDVVFQFVKTRGTSIQMLKPQYKLAKGLNTIKRNLSKMFPVISESFRIHIIRGSESVLLDSFNDSVISELVSLIIIGNNFAHLIEKFKPDVPEKIKELMERREKYVIDMDLATKTGEIQPFKLRIVGWVGAYKSTRGRKAEMLEF